MWPVYLDVPAVFDWVFGLIRGGGEALDANAEMALFWLGFWSMLISIILIMAITYLLVRLNETETEEKAMYATVYQVAESTPLVNPAWQKVLSYLDSDNVSDWKLAILEADALLDELLKRMGMPGENMGERLKAVDPADFDTLDAAWEAHKIRNQIAHQAGFNMSAREVRRVIDLYERVFTEFRFI